VHEKTRINQEKRRREIESFVNRFRAQATKASAVQSRVKMLEKMPTKERLRQIANLDFSFHYSPFEAKTLMQVEEISFQFDSHNPLIRNFSLTLHAKDRIAVIGKNGKGKSTLLNLMAGELAPQSGRVQFHPGRKLGYFGQTNINRLNPHLTVEEEIAQANPELNRTAARSVCGVMMFSGDHAEKKISVLSGGERSRVLLGKILAAPANLLFLDEPTNHLDMQSIESLMESLREFDGAVVIVTHSEMILREMATKLVVFQRGGVRVFNGGYDEFLEKVGWEEEGSLAKSVTVEKAPCLPPSSGVASKKEIRKQRSQVVAERSRILTPLKEEIASLEAEISSLEAELVSSNERLMEASKNKAITQFVSLSKLIKEIQEKIDKKFDRLEIVTMRHDEKNRHYEDLLGREI
ncbi:MAG: ABC-F family ATP-binding cassette domain-containing protein, partial [Deltaproteobacteria bacterium]|nr:ABC-F family ATP-binding cassette domain-containing protein [Deltaproteobacteria bacterium]